MGFAGFDPFFDVLEQHRDTVQALFDEIGWDGAGSDDDAGTADSILTAWDAGRLAETEGESLAPLDELRASGLYRRMDETSRQRLEARYTTRIGSLDYVFNLAVPEAKAKWLGLDPQAAFLQACYLCEVLPSFCNIIVI